MRKYIKKQPRSVSRLIKPEHICQSDVENRFNFNPCHVVVEFTEGLSVEEVATNINQLTNPQVILWYIGCNGLREAGVQFYKNFLIEPVLEQNEEAVFWLFDLTAWSAFRNPHCSVNKFNSCCEALENLLIEQIKCIKSVDIFKKFEGIADKELVAYFRKALQRKFIQKASQDFPKKNILIQDILSDKCPIAGDWYAYDAAKAYSIFQYFEGCLLVDEIFLHLASNREVKDIQIVFALPNDELKYYQDKQNSFKKDVTFLISKRCMPLNIKDVQLQIKFLSFKYGSQLNCRPYNALGKVLKKEDVTAERIVGKSMRMRVNALK